MDEVAIYGGSFDPVGLHHARVAGVVASILNRPVWFMPCWGHQYGKKLVSPIHRLQMCKIVTSKHDLFETCDFEIKHELHGAYYHTLQKLKEENPNNRFYTIIGTDNANDIADGKWMESERLISENPFIVVERGDHPPKSDWFLRGDHKYFSFGDIGEATAIRKAIQEGDANFAVDHLDPDVWAYIQREGLYQ